MPVLFGKDIRKQFRRDSGDVVNALDGVSLQAEHGTLTALVGPDGAGKTTLIRLITGLMTADSGELKVLDVDVAVDPQLRHAKAVVEIDHPAHGKVETINSPVFVAGSEKRKPVMAPEIGAHTREVLRELGYAPDAIEALIRSGAATATK